MKTLRAIIFVTINEDTARIYQLMLSGLHLHNVAYRPLRSLSVIFVSDYNKNVRIRCKTNESNASGAKNC